MKTIVIIPSRFGSSRFPGKPLAMIQGKPMIQHVYENAKKAFSDVWVATDDERIEQRVKEFGGNCVMTSSSCPSGTDRLAQAIQSIPNGDSFDIVINVQGDEPFIQAEQIQLLAGIFEKNSTTQIATLVKEVKESADLFNPNKPKVVVANDGRAIYFSRSPIPFVRGEENENWTKKHTYFKHIGIYAYKRNVLLEITKLPQSSLEKAESLEQLRWIENNYVINTALTEYENLCVDTPEDLEKILATLHTDSLK
ncbi:MAG: 3-deoxy-manno-octulosonate cytidylyltransferase [Bacteroidales bacterium]|nr:3-deoxy-manno-octulosonate cytidylyltransferase [Bacteroidales bacterium]